MRKFKVIFWVGDSPNEALFFKKSEMLEFLGAL